MTDKKNIIYKITFRLLCIIYCIGCAVALPDGVYPQRRSVRSFEQQTTEIAITDGASFKTAVAEAVFGAVIIVAGEIILSESITLQKNITIKKAEAAEQAVFLLKADPLNSARHFIIGDNIEAVFINICFKGHGSLSYVLGGGIEARRKSKLTLTGCSFRGNCNRFGGAVGMQESGSVSIYKCSFTYNRSAYNGGAIYAGGINPEFGDEDSEDINTDSSNRDFLSRVTITDSIIENNWAEYCGGGIQFDDFSEGEIRNCVINNNRVTKKGDIYLDGGGGIAVSVAQISVFGSIISNNEAQNGGGLYFNYMGYSERLTSVVANCIISKNTAYGNGGGIYAYRKSEVLFYGCAIYENVSERGGGICIGEKGDSRYDTEAKADFIFCTVALNRSTLECGGIYAIESYTSVYGTIIAGNISAGGELPKAFTMGADSICSDGYGDLFTDKRSENEQIKIKPYSLAHNKIPREDVEVWLANESLAHLMDIIGERILYGGFYDIGAFELPEYLIIFMADESIYSQSVYCDGELILLPDSPLKAGYTFKGWYCDSDFESAYAALPASGDLLLYAKWEKEAGLSGLAVFLIIAGSVLFTMGVCTGIYLYIYKKRILLLSRKINIPDACTLDIYPELSLLTPREMEVFKLLLACNTLRQITGELKIEYSTVNFHYKNIYRKLCVNSRIELLKKYSKFETS